MTARRMFTALMALVFGLWMVGCTTEKIVEVQSESGEGTPGTDTSTVSSLEGSDGPDAESQEGEEGDEPEGGGSIPGEGGQESEEGGQEPDVTEPVEDDASGCNNRKPEDEVCDGIDNDCDGEIDEDLCSESSGPCVASVCDPEAQACVDVPLEAGLACDDGDACTSDDACDDAGACVGAEVNCDDGNACTADSCDAAQGCVYENTDGETCDDGDLCTTGDTCNSGVCSPGNPVVCDSLNPCEVASCNPENGGCKVTPLPDGVGCDDGNACTQSDSCTAGMCFGAAKACDDGNICTTDSCDSQTGCVYEPNAFACDDGNACTQNDICNGGQCQAGFDVSCDDGNACTQDSCNPATGCNSAPKSGSCDDGNPCTNGDECQAGVCEPGTNLCACENNADCAGQEDGNLCNGTLYCDKSAAPYVCAVNPVTVVVCPDNTGGSQCQDMACDPESGQCGMQNIKEGQPCDADGTVCTVGDMCVDGSCLAGETANCDDGNPCTTDACDPVTGCSSVNNSGPCNADDNPCTLGDTCQEGNCAVGTTKVCDDGNPCTVDSCNLETGSCSYNAAPFEGSPCNADDSACTGGDVCTSGACVPGGLLNCDDDNPCTIDSCDASAGCVNTPNEGIGCDADNNVCTVGDACNASGSCIAGGAQVCDDSNPCTTDSCDAATGCTYINNTLPCDDGTACTEDDTCGEGACIPGAPVNCDDGNICTLNACDAEAGCQTSNKGSDTACDDGNACTAGDVCGGGACQSGSALNCDDGNVCTADACDPATGCASTPQTGGTCDDGNPCTDGDSCVAGSCDSGVNLCSCETNSDCGPQEDGNICNGTLYCDKSALPYVCAVNPATVVNCPDVGDGQCQQNVCDPASGTCGLENINEGQSCDADGSVCTVGDMCQSGACMAGAAANCDDGNVCTTTGCDPVAGCQTSNNTNLCNADDNACTQNDSCSEGLCNAGVGKTCDDGNDCTVDSCNAQTGSCVYTPLTDGVGCDADGSLCTVGDSCQAGTCAAGTLLDCDDGNGCTNDSCDPASGCQQTPNTAACDADDNACTQNDTCAAGSCVAGNAKTCNDNNPCTIDSCDTVTGACVFTPVSNGSSCNADDSVCTVGDTCQEGVCTAGADLTCDDANGCTTDTCDAVTGCVYTNNTDPCDADGNACTLGDTCAGGVCVAGTQKDCDDSNGCTLDTCDTGTGACASTPVVDGNSCDADGSVCTVGDTCQSGQCVPGASQDCDDGNECTTDSCNPSTGCQFANNENPCDADGNACTVGDKCGGGACVAGAAKVCNDGDICTADTCNTVSGACETSPQKEGDPCDADGSACTSGDSCQSGVCTAGPALNCDDGNGCTDDSCDPVAGCVNTNNTAPCDADGDLCTQDDTCAAGTCVAGAYLDCNDANDCTNDACDPASGVCDYDGAPFNGVACDADGETCTPNDSCQNGTCTADTPASVGTACDDGLFCTGADNCDAVGSCLSGSGVDCDDGNPCTVDSCDEASGACIHELVTTGTSCDDGLYCTVDETCNAAGVCGGGEPRECGAGGCVLGVCNEATDACEGQELPDGTLCNADDDGCTKNDFCQAGECQPGAPVQCYQPQDFCNDWSCISTGANLYQCVSNPSLAGTPCEDYLFCTDGDTCDGNGLCLGGPPTDCNAQTSSCQDGICDEGAKACVGQPIADGTSCNESDDPCVVEECSSGICVIKENTCGLNVDISVSYNQHYVDQFDDAKAEPNPPVIADLGENRFLIGWEHYEEFNTRSFRADWSREYFEHIKFDSSHWSPGSVFLGFHGLYASGPLCGGGPILDWGMYGGNQIDNGSSLCCKSYVTDYFYLRHLPQRTLLDEIFHYTGATTNHTSYSEFVNEPWRELSAVHHNKAAGTVLRVFSALPIANSQGSCNGGTCGYCQNYYCGGGGSTTGPQNIMSATIRTTCANGDEIDLGSYSDRRDPHGGLFDDGSGVWTWVDTGDGNIYAQRFAADGTLDPLIYQVNSAAGEIADPQVLTMYNGRYLIYWEHTVAGGDTDIRAQLFKNEPGNKSGSEFLVNTFAVGDQVNAQAIVFQDNTSLVIWEDRGGRDGDGYGIVGQYLTTSAKKDGSEWVINSEYIGDQGLPNIAVLNPLEFFVVAWVQDNDSDKTSQNNIEEGVVKARRFDKAGSFKDGILEFPVNTFTAGTQEDIELASPMVTNLTYGNGSFMAVWTTQHDLTDEGEIMARRYDDSGLPIGNDFQVNTITEYNQWRPDVAMDQSGNFAVVWESMDEDGDLEGVYAQRYVNTGAKAGLPFQVNAQSLNEQMRPAIAMQPGGQFAVAWEGYQQGDEGDNYDVVLRCFNADGSPLSGDIIANDHLPEKQMRPHVSAFPDGSNRYLVVWQSFHQGSATSNWDIVARIFNQSCSPIGNEIVINDVEGIAENPRGAVDLDGRWAVVYQESDNVELHRFSVDNLELNSMKVVLSKSAQNPDISFTTEQHLVIAWEEYDSAQKPDESGSASKAVELDYGGNRVLPEWYIHRTHAGNQSNPKVIGRPNGTFVSMWEMADESGLGLTGRLSNSGECVSDEDCNDQNICTTNVCVNNVCVNSNNTNICVTDGNPCTVDDVCKGGTCQGTPVECNDFNVCTNDFCDTDTGQCAAEPIPWCNGGCFYSEEPGCGGCNCEAQVCAEKPSCCSDNWGSICVQLCNQKYGGCDSPN